MATFRADITRSVEPAAANPALLGRAAEANARAVGTLTNLAGEMYKGYVAGQMVDIENEAATAAGEFFIKGQAAEQAAAKSATIQAARGTVFGQFDESAPLEQQEAVGRQLGAFDNELNRLKAAVEGGMSNVQYISRIDSIVKKAIGKFPGLADQIRERVASVTGMPGADRWAQMSYVRDRFTPPKEGKAAKTEEDMALQDIDEIAKTGLKSREELLKLYRENRGEYNVQRDAWKQILTQQTETARIKAYYEGLSRQNDAKADQMKSGFAAIFNGSLAASTLVYGVQDKESTYGNTLALMAQGDPRAVDPVKFDTLVQLHNIQMRTNIMSAHRQAAQVIETYTGKNPDISPAKVRELYENIDRQRDLALSQYSDKDGVGLKAMATVMRTYRDKTVQEKQQLVDLSIKQMAFYQNSPLVQQYLRGGADRENLKRTNKDFYEIMVNQEKQVLGGMASLSSSIQISTDLSNIQRQLLQGQQTGQAVPADPAVPAQTTRAAHQVQMSNAQEALKKTTLLPEEVNNISSAFSTSAVYGANSLVISKDYRMYGEKILKLSAPDQAIIKSNVSKGVVQSVNNVAETKRFIEQRYGVQLQLGVNDAGEIGVVAPAPVVRPGVPAPRVSQQYLQASEEFTRQLKPVLSNMVSLRAMLTQEQPKAVGQDFATLINNNQPYGGFFSMEAKPVEAAPAVAAPAATATPAFTSTPAAPGTRTSNVVSGRVVDLTTPATPAQAAPAASAATQTTATFNTLGYPVRKPYESEDKYFKANPNVAGMATEDGAVILNPYSTLSDTEKQAVALNEAYRLYMRENKIVPKFELTEEQKKFFTGSEYANNPDAAKQTIVARILSGDPSAKATAQQKAEAKKIADQQKQKPAASGKRTASMADVARYAAEKKISVSDAVSQLEAEGVDVIGN